MKRPKIAVIHPQLIPGGGSEVKPLWILEALKNDYECYLITMGNVNLKTLNESYGTNLKPYEIEIISIPIPFLFKKRFDALRSYRLTRYCRKEANKFDLMISTYNIMDFGKKGIQCIADFSFDDRLRQNFHPEPQGIRGLFYKSSPLRSLYLKLAGILSGGSNNGWKNNLTIANSNWSKRIMKERYGIEAITIYPPVASEFPEIPWEKRENGFVVLARLSPEKRIEKIIEILQKVRKKGYDIHLHILGRIDNSRYVAEIKKLCEKNNDWIFMEGLIIGNKKLEFIALHKFGISGRENEPFGIAIAEMVKAGCIVWVPDGGGQVEIVDHPALIFKNEEEAVVNIQRVLDNIEIQDSLRKHLSMSGQRFSVETFMKAIRDVVDEFLRQRN